MPKTDRKDGVKELRKGLDKAREIAKKGQVFPEREGENPKRPKKEKE